MFLPAPAAIIGGPAGSAQTAEGRLVFATNGDGIASGDTASGAERIMRGFDFPVARNGNLLVSDSLDRLYLLDPARGRPKLLRGIRLAGVAGGHDASFSPDGRQVAVQAGQGLVIFDLETRKLRLIARTGRRPSWSPDGSRIAYESGERPAIWIKYLGTRRPPRRFGSGTWPSWSPNGKWIAYGLNGGGVALKSLAGAMRPLLRDHAEDNCSVRYDRPDWSPVRMDQIAYTQLESCSGSMLAASGIGITGRQCCLSETEIEGPDWAIWAPDGKRIAYSDSRAGVKHLRIFRFPSSLTTRLNGDWQVLDWQPLCTIAGSEQADRIRGRARDDLVCGFAGADVIGGGAGQDRILGGEGDDRIDAIDGHYDLIGCGPGRDIVNADATDLISSDCERAWVAD